MSPRELLSDLRARGIELRLADDVRHVLFRGASAEDLARIKSEKLWLLMLLAHELGADLYDPRLVFLAHAGRGLTGAIRTRMEIAFGIDRELAEKAGYLQRKGDVLEPVGDVAVVLARERKLPPA